MSRIYTVKQGLGGINIVEQITEYSLSVDLTRKNVPLKEFPSDNELMFTAPGHHGHARITGRDLAQHHSEVGNMVINPSFQYVEIGAGLGEFTPHLVKTTPHAPKPIVVDPANYWLMKDVLDYARSLNLSARINKLAEILSKRAAVISDPSKVMLINMTLMEAFEAHPSLEGIADVVIDHGGAYSWCEETEKQASEIGDKIHTAIQDLERRLAKPSGKVICLPPPPLYSYIF
ncbi:hypothetical protein HYX05_03730 [Candidatus Woesearchaeota archaeon]|nr:hypothetical protein [Candidatus Woesearchaeota archaeon]